MVQTGYCNPAIVDSAETKGAIDLTTQRKPGGVTASAPGGARIMHEKVFAFDPARLKLSL
jgi:hypothetical protein